MEAYGLAHRPDRGAPLPSPGGVQRRHRRQLRIRLFLVFLPGRLHSDGGKAHRHNQHRRRSRGRDSQVRHAGCAATQRPRPPALFQLPTGYARGRREQFGIRGEYRSRAPRPRQSPRQRLLRRANPAPHGTRGATGRRSHARPVLDGCQPLGQKRPGAAGKLQADARREHSPLCPPRRQHHQTRRVL